MSTNSLTRLDYLWMSGLLLLCLTMTLLYGQFGRPIWIDEFLHFAVGSHNSTREVWETIRRTTVEVNHGQTGFYILLDYWLMKVFGANLLALRVPSILSTFWLLISGFLILRTRGFGWAWMYLLAFCLMGQLTLMRYVAEARPYMPLVAASSGALAYYLLTLESRQQLWVRWFGAISVIWGVLMHPYFSVYWAVLWVFAYWYHCHSENFQIGVRTLLTHLNIRLTIVGTTLFFLIGALTWMRPGPEFDFDPYQWIAKDGYWNTFFDISLFQFVRPIGAVVTGLLLVSLMVYVFLPAQTKSKLKPIIPPLILIIAMLLVTGLLTLISHYRDYWVLPRQWVASIALVAVGFVWLIAEFSRLISRLHVSIGIIICISTFLYVINLAIPSGVNSYKKVEEYFTRPNRLVNYSQEQPVHITPPKNNDEWVALANINLRAGGEVWPVFRTYYGLEE